MSFGDSQKAFNRINSAGERAYEGPAWTIPEFHSARRIIDTSFGEIAYVERGEGPVALFIHGWPLNGYHWRGAMAGLSDIRRCIAIDLMGLGYSEVPERTDLSPVSQVRMIAEVLEALAIDRFDLVANDSGMAIAQLLAVHHSPRVRSLLLTNGDVHTNSPPPALKPWIEMAKRDELIGWFDRQASDPAFAGSSEGLGFVYTDPAFFAPLVDVYLKPLISTPVRRLQCQQYGVAFEPNPLIGIESELHQLEVPARMVWGTGDQLFPVEWAEWLDAALPCSRGVRLVKGANLFFPEELPEIIVEEARHLWH